MDENKITFFNLSKEELFEMMRDATRTVISEQKPEQKPIDKLLSYTETMSLLNIKSRTALHQYCKKGLLTGKRIGKKLFFSEREIQDALKVN